MIIEKARGSPALAIVLIMGSLLIIHQVLLPTIEPPTQLFHLIYGALLLGLALMLVGMRPHSSALFLLVALFGVLAMRLVIHVRIPGSALFGPDVNYERQLLEHIVRTGRVGWDAGTGQSAVYRYYPGLETLLASLHHLSGISVGALLRYFGAFAGLVTVVCVRSLFMRIWKNRLVADAGAVIFGLCSWLVAFDSYTNHQMLGFLVLSAILLALYLPGARGFSLVVILVLVLAVSHHLTAYFLILISMTGFAWSHLYGGERAGARRLAHAAPVMMAVILLWLLYVSVIQVKQVGSALVEIASKLAGSNDFTTAPVAPVGVKPIWMVILQYLGFASFGVLTLVGAWHQLRTRRSREGLFWYFVGGVLFTGFLGMWIAGFSRWPDIQWRGLIYFYLGGAPLVALVLHRRLATPNTTALRRLAAVGLILLVLSPAIYHGIPPKIYDSGAPADGHEDIRAPLEAWAAAGVFVRFKGPDGEFAGTRLPYTYYGGVGLREVGAMGTEGEVLSLADVLASDRFEAMGVESDPWVQPGQAPVAPKWMVDGLEGWSLVFSGGDPLLYVRSGLH